MLYHNYNISTQEDGAGLLLVQGQTELQSKVL